MCFSAEASFISAGILGMIGYATKKAVSKKRDLLWAAIPVFFAIQQFCEGVVWLDLQNDITHSSFTVGAKNLYLIFAYAFWPIWIPLAVYAAETKMTRRKIIGIFLIIGIAVVIINLTQVPPDTIIPSIHDHSIHYTDEGPFYKRIPYIAAVSIPPCISSLRLMWIFGPFAAISSVLTSYYYSYTFTSTWCFCGAILSIILYFVAKSNTEIKASTPRTDLKS